MIDPAIATIFAALISTIGTIIVAYFQIRATTKKQQADEEKTLYSRRIKILFIVSAVFLMSAVALAFYINTESQLKESEHRLKEEINKLGTKIDSLKTVITNKQDEIENQQHTIKMVTNDTLSLRQKIRTKTTEIDSINGLLASKEERISSLNTLVRDEQKKLRDYKDRIEELTKIENSLFQIIIRRVEGYNNPCLNRIKEKLKEKGFQNINVQAPQKENTIDRSKIVYSSKNKNKAQDIMNILEGISCVKDKQPELAPTGNDEKTIALYLK